MDEILNRVLEGVLAESRNRGFLGPGPLGPQIRHAQGFASLLEGAPRAFLDLGSGGGVPGLVLAIEWCESSGVLLDAAERRTEFLREACEMLGLTGRIEVVCGRAEEVARTELRGRFDVVTARSFGGPATTAECGAPFLAPEGLLVVSEPPTEAPARWPADGLDSLGLEVAFSPTATRRYVALRRTGPLDDRWPRRTGVPAKRPLWR